MAEDDPTMPEIREAFTRLHSAAKVAATVLASEEFNRVASRYGYDLARWEADPHAKSHTLRQLEAAITAFEGLAR